MSDFLDVASLALENLPDENDVSAVPDKEGVALSFGVIGAGQAGGGLAAAFWRMGYRKVVYYNTTDRDDVGGTPLPPEHRVICETQAGGAGKNIARAQELLGQTEGVLYARLSKIFGHVERIFVCASLGGGTGCGSVVGLVRMADKYLTSRGIANGVSVIAALPTTAECSGAVVKNNARTVLAELQDAPCTLYLVDNDRILQLFSRLTLPEVMPTANSSVVQLLDVFNRSAASASPYFSCDATDLATVLSAPGLSTMGIANVPVTGTQEDLIKAMTASVRTRTILMSPDNLAAAKVGACVVLVPKLVLDTVPGIMTMLGKGWDALQQISGNATLHRGLYPTGDDKFLRVFVHVSGLSVPNIPRLH